MAQLLVGWMVAQWGLTMAVSLDALTVAQWADLMVVKLVDRWAVCLGKWWVGRLDKKLADSLGDSMAECLACQSVGCSAEKMVVCLV